MIDLDEHKNQLNELWSKPVFDNLSASSITAMLKKREHSIVKKLKLVFRIEILICLIEIVQDCFALSSAKDSLFIGYNIFNIVLSAVFIFIFIKLIRRMNHPRLITLPLADIYKNIIINNRAVLSQLHSVCLLLLSHRFRLPIDSLMHNRTRKRTIRKKVYRLCQQLTTYS